MLNQLEAGDINKEKRTVMSPKSQADVSQILEIRKTVGSKGPIFSYRTADEPDKWYSIDQAGLVAMIEGKLDKTSVKKEHDNSDTNVYSTEQTNNEIIDSFKYNFRQEFKESYVYYETVGGTTLTKTKDYGVFSIKGTNTSKWGGTSIIDGFKLELLEGHKYYINIIKEDKLNKLPLYIYFAGEYYLELEPLIITGKKTNYRVGYHNINHTNLEYDTIIAPILIDLTEMFGAGNEPSTVEEVQQYLVPNKYYPYGKNIEPSMYVTKAEVNKVSNVMSETVDVYTSTTTSNIFKAKFNGSISVSYNGNGVDIAVRVTDNTLDMVLAGDDLNSTNNSINRWIFLPIVKGHEYNVYRSETAYSKLIYKIIHAEEL